jgi:hypothetical protein
MKYLLSPESFSDIYDAQLLLYLSYMHIQIAVMLKVNCYLIFR